MYCCKKNTNKQKWHSKTFVLTLTLTLTMSFSSLQNCIISGNADGVLDHFRKELEIYLETQDINDIHTFLICKKTHRETLLHLAARYNRIDYIKELINVGADCNKCNFEGRSPIFLVDDKRCLKELVAAGAHVNTGDTIFMTPLHIAAFNKNISILKMLIAYGANVNARDVEETSPLHYAASEDVHCVRELIAAGANIDACDYEGRTPLHEAATFDKLDCLQELIEAGANIDKLDSMNKTALDIAKKEESKECELFLLQFMSERERLNQTNKV